MKKKLLSILLSLVLVLAMMPYMGTMAFAADGHIDLSVNPSGTLVDNEDGHITYSFDSSTKTMTLSGTGATGDFNWTNVPFYYAEIHSLVIEEGITSVGDELMREVTGLNSVSIPSTLTYFGDGYESAALSRTAVGAPGFTVAAGNETYYADNGCLYNGKKNSLVKFGGGATSYDTPDDLKTVKWDALSYVTLDSLIYDGDGLVVENYATEYASIKHVEFREGVASIGSFGSVDGLEDTVINIPSTCEAIGDQNILWSPSIEAINVAPGNPVYYSIDGVLYANRWSTTYLWRYPANKPETSYTVPAGIKTIGFIAFGSADNLREIIIPSYVETINWIGSTKSPEENPLTIKIYGKDTVFKNGNVFNYHNYLNLYGWKDSTTETFYNTYAGGGWTFNQITEDLPAPLALTYDEKYDVPDTEAGTALEAISISDAVSGGKAPYTFAKAGGPEWISITSDGKITGTPSGALAKGILTVKVTDANGDFATMTIPVGKTVEEVASMSMTGFITPEYGGSTEVPAMSIPSINAGISYTEWYKKNDEGVWNSYKGTTFEEGEYFCHIRVEVFENTGIIHKITGATELTVDGEAWENEIAVTLTEWTSSSSFCSPIYTITKPALVFTDSSSYDIPASTVGKAIKSVSVAGAVSGGKAPYTFSKKSGPSWVKVSSAGKITGTPTAEAAAKTLTVQVEDALGQTAAISIKVGKVSAAAVHVHDAGTVKEENKKPGNVDGDNCTVERNTYCNGCGELIKSETVIVAKAISGLGTEKADYAYNGKVQKPKLAIRRVDNTLLEEGVDYKILSYPDNAKNVGTYRITVKFIGNYEGEDWVDFEIVPASIAKKTASLSKTKYVYTAKACKPAVTISGLTSGTHFTVSYANNTKVGKATVTIKGKGNYTGTIKKTFTINPKKAAISSTTPGTKKLTVKMSTKVSSTGGSTYEIKYRVKGSSSWKTTTTTSQSKTISSLKKGKTYQVKVRAYKTVNGVKYYGAYSDVKTSKKIK